MSGITVQIDAPSDISDRMATLTQNWQTFAYKALGEALSMDDVLAEIRRRTPRSELDSQWNLRKDGTRIRDRDFKGKGKDSYIPGMGNLVNDLKLQPVTDGGPSRSFSIGFGNVAYAGHVHEMDDQRTNWTHSGTGSHFLSGVIEAQADSIPETISKNIESMMKDAGII